MDDLTIAREEYRDLILWLIRKPKECEWVEFKLNFHNPDEIGERISALANGACLNKQPFGYLIFGVENENLSIVGTTFKPNNHKKGNELIEHWLNQMINPKTDFKIRWCYQMYDGC